MITDGQTSIVFITGIPVAIRWKWHSSDKIEWELDFELTDANHAKHLLENFLRAMRSGYVEYMLNEEHRAKIYENDARAAALAEDFNPF